MSDKKEYTRDEMVQWIAKYYEDLGYKTHRYSDDFLPARVPLYCVRKESDAIDEMAIEITTDRIISRDAFFPDITVHGVKIPEASSVRFYQHYFPKAKIYYAYPDYAQENNEFNEFKDICTKRAIGLLKVSPTGIQEVVGSRSLFDTICTQLAESKKTREDVEKIIGGHFENYLHQLVHYPDPDYRRRVIIRRRKEDIRISFMLLKKLQEPRNIEYGEKLKELTSNYFQKETRDDFEIASDYVEELWKEYLGLEYPNPSIQTKFEEIFLREFGYREHFVHQFQVFLLGAYIIDGLYDSRQEQIETFLKSHRVPIEIAWLAASTYHDFNYSTQKYESWLIEYLEEVLRFKNQDIQKELSKLNLDLAIVRENFLLTSEKLIEIICQKYLEEPEAVRDKINLFLYEKIVRKRNHGLISSLTLWKIYSSSRERKEPKITKEGIEQAALSIALHDEKMWEFFCGCKGYLLQERDCGNSCRKKNECDSWDNGLRNCRILDTIDFDKEPLLYLLILCDSAHDEGRVQQESLGIETSLEDVEIGGNGKVSITLSTGDTTSHRIKYSEFSRVEQFLDDGKFEVLLKPGRPSYGKEKRFTV